MGRVADWVSDETLEAVEAALKSPADRLALRVSRHTGLRIGDVLALETRQLERQRVSVREAKTGKRRQVYLPRGLWQALRDMSGRSWVFEGMTPLRHRSYDALWLDLRQAVRSVGLREAVSAHSWRKGYAVAKYRETGSVEAVRRLMGHDSETVTMLYALSDVLTRDRLASRPGEAGHAAEAPTPRTDPGEGQTPTAGSPPTGQRRRQPPRTGQTRPGKAPRRTTRQGDRPRAGRNQHGDHPTKPPATSGHQPTEKTQTRQTQKTPPEARRPPKRAPQ